MLAIEFTLTFARLSAKNLNSIVTRCEYGTFFNHELQTTNTVTHQFLNPFANKYAFDFRLGYKRGQINCKFMALECRWASFNHHKREKKWRCFTIFSLAMPMLMPWYATYWKLFYININKTVSSKWWLDCISFEH